MRVDLRTQKIFAHAVALEQNGRLKNTIYLTGDRVYVLNQDNTVLLRFQSKNPFSHPLGIRANDYDSEEFVEEDGKVVFIQKSGEFERRKVCGTPDLEPSEVEKMFKRFKAISANSVTLPDSLLSLLDDGLSHVEFKGVKGNLHVIQRDIFTGNRLEIVKVGNKKGTLGLKLGDKISDFGPVAMRTSDFMALFSFNPVLTLKFDPKVGYFYVVGKEFNMEGFVSQCLYDEMGTITETKGGSDGREEQKDGGSEQGPRGATRRKKSKGNG